MFESMRTPRSTPETADAVAMRTDSATSPIWAAVPCGMPNRIVRATFNCTIPTPREAAIPIAPPMSAAASTTSPRIPSV